MTNTEKIVHDKCDRGFRYIYYTQNIFTLIIEKWVVKIILTLTEDKYNEEIKFVLHYQIISVQLKVVLKCKLFHQCKLIGTFLAWHRWSNEYNYAGSMKWAISKSFVKTGNTGLEK